MSTIAITKSGQFAFMRNNRGDLMIDEDIKEVGDLVRSQLSVLQGSYILDPDYGIDLTLSDIEIRDEVVGIILAIPNVEGIKNLIVDIDRIEKNFKISAIVTTSSGSITI